jgi:hypothetical protein
MPGPIIFEVDVQIALSLASIGYLGEGASNDVKFKLMTAALKQPDLPTERDREGGRPPIPGRDSA